jgi:hypothetical protein
VSRSDHSWLPANHLWLLAARGLLLTPHGLPGTPERPTAAQVAPSVAVQTLSEAELSREKLRQEIVRLESDNESSKSLLSRVAPLGTFLTTCIAFVAAFVALWGQLTERRRERRQKLDEIYSRVATDLGSDKLAIKSGAALSSSAFYSLVMRPTASGSSNRCWRICESSTSFR